jgi:uroporphyrinogen decarboxylase
LNENLLKPIDRIRMTVDHRRTDRLPRGELLVEEAFLDRLYPEEKGASYFEKMRWFAEELSLDLVTVRIDFERLNEGLSLVRRWVKETPHFIMALIDGLFWKPEDPLSFQEFLLGISREEERIRDLIDWKRKKALRLTQMCLNEGAHGCIIAGDLAYNQGPFLSPANLKKWIFPGLQEIAEVIKRGHGIAFLHSCGDLTEIISLIFPSAFDGIHGLAPSAGNDPIAIRKKTCKKLTLMGIFEVDHLNPLQIENMKEKILPLLTAEGGYILGSSGGLSMNTPIDSFRALYMTGEGQ